MYKPKFNSVLVEIDEADKKWGNAGEGDSISARLGKSYSKGRIVNVMDTEIIRTDSHPISDDERLQVKKLLKTLEGKYILWNEGHEAGTLFEDDEKLYAFIYWWDIRGVQDEPAAA